MHRLGGRRGGDGDVESSFEALFRECYPRILRYGLRRTDAQTAQDIAADTFAVAWRRFEEIPAGHEQPWLYATARRLLANEMRSWERRERLCTRLSEDRSAGGVSSDVAAAVVDREYLQQLLSVLTAVEREALELVEWDGLTGVEAARVVGCSPATLRVRLFRARRRLLEEHETFARRRPAAGVEQEWVCDGA